MPCARLPISSPRRNAFGVAKYAQTRLAAQTAAVSPFFARGDSARFPQSRCSCIKPITANAAMPSGLYGQTMPAKKIAANCPIAIAQTQSRTAPVSPRSNASAIMPSRAGTVQSRLSANSVVHSVRRFAHVFAAPLYKKMLL